jgi:hypothetical protein
MRSSLSASFVLIAYKQEKYIRAAVEAALAQEGPSLQIILSDDCSPDGTFEIMQEVVESYSGPHRPELYRNPRNLGIAGHVNTVLSRCKGDIFVLAAGDDISRPTRMRDTLAAFEADPRLSLVALQASEITADGSVTQRVQDTGDCTIEAFLEDRCQPHGATRGYRREVFERFGPLAADCPTEDTTFLFRSLLMGAVRTIDAEGILYRKHDESLSAPNSMRQMRIESINAQYLRDLETARDLGIVDADAFDRTRRAVLQKARRRMAMHRITYGSEGGLTKLRLALTAPGLAPRQRLRLARVILPLRSHLRRLVKTG